MKRIEVDLIDRISASASLKAVIMAVGPAPYKSNNDITQAVSHGNLTVADQMQHQDRWQFHSLPNTQHSVHDSIEFLVVE